MYKKKLERKDPIVICPGYFFCTNTFFLIGGKKS